MLYIFDMGGVVTNSAVLDDKLSKVLGISVEEFERICAPYGCQAVVLTSAENGLGMDELRALLEASMAAEDED